MFSLFQIDKKKKKKKKMSSWLSISLPNLFKSSQSNQNPSLPPENAIPSSDDYSPSHAGGVKEDLSGVGQTIGRQLHGVASFLTPPSEPLPHSASDSDSSSDSSSQAFIGIKNDLVEIGGSFKSGLWFALNFLQFNEDDEDEDTSEVAGIAPEVLGFVQEISLQPECWAGFPLSLENDFVMSDAQREHILTVEHLVPSLATLGHKLQSNLSDEQFWMIYFILLLPRLNEQDSKRLSTPELVDARKILLKKLQNKRNAHVHASEILNSFQEGDKVNYTQGDNSASHAKQISAEIVKSAQGMENDGHENTEQRLDKEDIKTCTSVDAQKQQVRNEEDVSFSDLEDDDNNFLGKLSRFRLAQDNRDSSPSGSNDEDERVQLNKIAGTQGGWHKTGQTTCTEKDSEGEGSNDWLTVDDLDLDSLAII